uniref:Uncharacterized protein n=1 Tax=Cannabis sativa TaxID=3483 RepID=A0A803QNU5_CANSA
MGIIKGLEAQVKSTQAFQKLVEDQVIAFKGETIPNISSHLGDDIEDFSNRVKTFNNSMDEYLQDYDGGVAAGDDEGEITVKEAEDAEDTKDAQVGDTQTLEVVDIPSVKDDSLPQAVLVALPTDPICNALNN